MIRAGRAGATRQKSGCGFGIGLAITWQSHDLSIGWTFAAFRGPDIIIITIIIRWRWVGLAAAAAVAAAAHQTVGGW